MPAKPPRLLPTLALAALWLTLYLVWMAVRPTEPETTTQTPGRTAPSTSTTTVPPLLKLKP